MSTLRKTVVLYSLENKSTKTWKEVCEAFNLEGTDKNIKMVNDWFRYYKNTGNYEPVTYTQEEDAVTVKEVIKDNTIPDGFKIKSIWNAPNGDLRYSYERDENSSESKLDVDYLRLEMLKHIKPQYTYKEVTGKTLMLFIGDAHVGLSVDNEAMITHKVLDFKSTLLSLLNLIDQPFKEVVVVYGGDMTDSVQNHTSRGGHYLPSRMTDREMFETFISASKEFFTLLANHPFVGNVSFYSVAEDNHTASMAGIFSRSLEIWLNIALPDIETKVFTEFIDSIEKDGHIFIFTHGKDAREQFKGLPLILDPKTESYLMSWCMSKRIIPNYKTTHVVKFDLHQSSYQLGKFFSYLNCLSAQIGSKWQQSNFMSSCPGVSYSIISSNGISNGEYFL